MRTIIVIFAFIYVVNGGLTDGLGNIATKLKDRVKEEATSVKDAAKEEITNIKDNVKTDVDEAKTLIDSTVDIQKSILKDAAGNVFDHMEKIPRIPAQQLIAQEGYPVESYYVTTSDGYILNILRIPSGKDMPSNGKVVYLQHGLMAACTDWILFGQKRGLAYILADLGFDVWLGNNRGNVYSRNHTRLNPDKDAEFWNFSWHEIGIIDIPATIDFILAKTGDKKLYHVGHSQGTTSFYVMTSMRPEYNKKIIHHISLAPIGFMNHLFSPLLRMVAFGTFPIGFGLESFGLNEFLPTEGILTFLSNTACSAGIGRVACKNVLFAGCGFNPNQINASALPLISSHYPAGAATKQIVHYGQGCQSGKFAQFDFGVLKNPTHYHSITPPNYDLSKITAPMTIIYSKNDWLSAPVDVERLVKEVKSVKEKYLVPDPLWNHIDYLFGNDAPKIVYTKVVDVLMNN